MGEIADMMLDGTLCEGCGEALLCENFHMYCSIGCAKDRGADKGLVCDCTGDSDDGMDWPAFRAERKEKKWRNEKDSLKVLRDKGIKYEILNEASAHYRIGTISFWPTTGKFYDPKTNLKGRGVFELLKVLPKNGQ